MTRAEAATLIVNAMGYDLLVEGEDSFVDIADEWYTSYVNTAHEHGVVSGIDEDSFAPDRQVSRVEMVTMIHNTLGEDFSIGNLNYICVADLQGEMEGFTIYNSEGQKLDIMVDEDGVTHYGFNGDYSYSTDHSGLLWGSGLEYFLPECETYSIQSENGVLSGCEMTGSNARVFINGENINKAQVNADGTIYLYGTDMNYEVTYINVTFELETSATGADDVVLKVVDKQLVEVTE